VPRDLTGQKLSPQEVRALLLTSTPLDHRTSSAGMFPTMLFPHPGTEDGARRLELALTVVCAPLILAGTAALAVRRVIRRKPISVTGEAGPVLAMALFGSLPLDQVLALLDFSGAARLAVGLGSLAALSLRAVIRARATPSGE
jgi:hypothetical protein